MLPVLLLVVLAFGLVYGSLRFLARDDVWRMSPDISDGADALMARGRAWASGIFGRSGSDASGGSWRGARRGWQGAVVRGRAQVIDGDSLRVGGVEVRLHGVDAPEARQTCRNRWGRRYACGARAAEHLRRLVRGRRVVCQRRDTDRYGRMVAVCRVRGRDIGRQMVHDGWAVAFVRYSRAYVGDERAARLARRGLWQGRFVLPAVWRRLRQR